MTSDTGTEESEKNNKDKQTEIPLLVQCCEEEEVEGKMGPGWIALEPSLADTGPRHSDSRISRSGICNELPPACF